MPISDLILAEARVQTKNKYKPVSVVLWSSDDDETAIDLRIGDSHPAEHVWLTRAQAAMIASILDAMSRAAFGECP